MGGGWGQGMVIAGVILTGTSGKDYHGMVTKAWVCAVSPIMVVRTGLHSPITYCSNQCQWLGYYKERHCWLAVWVLTCLGPRCQPLPRAVLMLHIVKGKR